MANSKLEIENDNKYTILPFLFCFLFCFFYMAALKIMTYKSHQNSKMIPFRLLMYNNWVGDIVVISNRNYKKVKVEETN